MTDKKTGTPFRKMLIETQINSHITGIKDFLNQDFIFEVNDSYGIDLLKLIDTLDENQKKQLLIKLLKE